MKAIHKQTNVELLETYMNGTDSQALEVIQECFSRFRWYVENGELAEHDTADDTYRNK